MKTLRKKNTINITRKNKIKPLIKILQEGFPLYASKKSYGDRILEYTKGQELKFHNSCLFGNMSWFGDLEEAKSYKTKDEKIFKWIIKRKTNLLIMNKENEVFFEYYFTNTKKKLKTTIEISVEQIEKIKEKIKKENINCNYLNLSLNERAFFEFKFAYGYITIEEQYEFMRLVKLLIEQNILDIKMREGSSIINKLKIKVDYYYFLSKINKINKDNKYNRLSIYLFDKYALNNLCKILPSYYKIDGVLVKNMKSFWFPNIIIYKMNIKEYVLFNPHHNLIYKKIIE